MMYHNAQQSQETASLEDYIEAVRRRKWLVLALVLLTTLGALLLAFSGSKTYTAKTTILIRPSPVGSQFTDRDAAPNLEREREIISSNAVAAEVITILGTKPSIETVQDRLKVAFRPESDVLQVEYTARNSVDAAALANEFATVYVNQREQLAIDHYSAIVTTSQDQATAIQAELRSTTSPSRSEDLNNQLANLDEARNEANQKLASRQPAAQVLRVATVPKSADGLNPLLIAIVGLILGLIAGVAIAFFLERLDTTARDEDDVARALGASVMGSIPTLSLGQRAGSNGLIMLTSGGSSRLTAAREAFRRLRSSIQFLSTSAGVSSIIVTSASPGEGKSLTAANLSIALAQNGSRVVLVSADLRKPVLEKMLAMEADRPGLAEFLSGSAELNAEKVPDIENLWLIRAGIPPSNPGELLNSDTFQQLIYELERENVEYIVIDTPPLLSAADAVSASRYVDGVLIVVDSERTETADLLQVKAELARSGSKLLGAVMNRQKFGRNGLFQRDKYTYYRPNQR